MTTCCTAMTSHQGLPQRWVTLCPLCMQYCMVQVIYIQHIKLVPGLSQLNDEGSLVMIPRGGSQGMRQTSINSLMCDAAEILCLEHLSYNAGTIAGIVCASACTCLCT